MQPFYTYPQQYSPYQPYQMPYNQRQGQGQGNYQYQSQQPTNAPFTSFSGNPTPVVAYVNGIEGAKGYVLFPNQTAILFDSDDKEKFYVKTADANGVPTLEKYKKIKEGEQPITAPTEYVSKKEFDEMSQKFEKSIGDLQKLLQTPSVLKRGE